MSLSRCSIVVTWRASARTRLATAAIVLLLAIAPVLASSAAPRQSSRAQTQRQQSGVPFPELPIPFRPNSKRR